MRFSDVLDLDELAELPSEFCQTFRPKNIIAKGYPWFTLRGDGSAFCALFMDNLATQMNLAGVAIGIIGLPPEFVWNHFFAGVGLSIFVGNTYYTFQASKVAMRTGKNDVCAQPYGINTSGALAKSFGILLPVYLKTGDAKRAWETACVANFFGGAFEVMGAFIAPVIAKNIPQPAFMAPIGGIGMSRLGVSSLVDLMGSHTARNPMAGFIPFVIIWVAFFGSPHKGLFGSYVPSAFVALIVGVILCYIAMSDAWEDFVSRVDASTSYLHWHGLSLPGWGYMGDAMSEHGRLVLGLSLTSFIATYACNIAARKGDDPFPIMESMVVDGMGTMLGALFGSPYNTTVYIGHVTYKSLGATRGYSLLNGVVWLIFGLFGIHALIDTIIPHEVVLGVLIAVGVSMSIRVINCSPRRWYPAVLLGMTLCFVDYIGQDSPDRAVQLLRNGYVLISVLYTIVLIMLTDRWFRAASAAFVTLSFFSFLGIIHASEINIKYNDKGTIKSSEDMMDTEGLPGWKLISTYLMCAVLCMIFCACQQVGLFLDPPEEEDFRILQARELYHLTSFMSARPSSNDKDSIGSKERTSSQDIGPVKKESFMSKDRTSSQGAEPVQGVPNLALKPEVQTPQELGIEFDQSLLENPSHASLLTPSVWQARAMQPTFAGANASTWKTRTDGPQQEK